MRAQSRRRDGVARFPCPDATFASCTAGSLRDRRLFVLIAGVLLSNQRLTVAALAGFAMAPVQIDQTPGQRLSPPMN